MINRQGRTQDLPADRLGFEAQLITDPQKRSDGIGAVLKPIPCGLASERTVAC